MIPRLFPTCLCLAVLLTSGCLFSKKTAQPKENPSIPGSVEGALKDRWIEKRAAELTALIRSLEADGVTVSVGGEIGEVGKVNSTPDELRAYLDGYNRELQSRAPGAKGLSKVSVQTGTSHGGIPLQMLRKLAPLVDHDYILIIAALPLCIYHAGLCDGRHEAA
jgi:hypothetical protein